jgi:hypothetical protein
MAGKKQKVHFPGVGKCKFHAERQGKCDIGSGRRAPQDAATNPAATKGGGCTYASNTTETRRKEKQHRNMRSHHVVPLTAYKRYKRISAYRGFEGTITTAYRGTSYCANQSPNMKWLPAKTTYRRQRVYLKSAVWDLDLPCHDIDHDGKDQGYTFDVIQKFKKIWDQIKSRRQQGKCFSPDEMITELRELEKDCQSYLETLSHDRGGTRNAIHRQGDMASFWWLPFSMAMIRVAKTRPIFRFGQRPKSR